jgi:hypothetical protein
MRCKVHGCNRQLDHDGRPVEYCDYQQGGCPMQKQKLDATGHAVIIGMFTLLFFIIWLTI